MDRFSVNLPRTVGGEPVTSPYTELETLGDWIRFAESCLRARPVAFGHGYVSARDEAQLMVTGCLKLPPDAAQLYRDNRLTFAERQRIHDAIDQRCVQFKPLAYVTGEIWFHGQRFLCDERALVPRSLIAERLLDQLHPWVQDPQKVLTVLDLCTGGGSLAVFAHQAFPNAIVHASDISREALQLARSNLDLHHVDPLRVRLVESDLFAAFTNQRWDLIICNPPYVNSEAISRLPREYSFEPQGALAAGQDGMDVIRKILAEAGSHLNDDGLLILEIGHEAEHFESAFPSLEFSYVPVEAGEDLVVAVEASAIRRSYAYAQA